MEALKVSPKTAMTHWKKHINKLVGRYNDSFGLQKLVLISYVDCAENRFKDLYEKFRDHMKVFRPKNSWIKPHTFERCSSPKERYIYLFLLMISRNL